MEILEKFPRHAHRATWQEHVIPWVAVAGLALAVPLEGQEVTASDRFGLFTECAPIFASGVINGEEAEEIGLTRDRIDTMAESRLRAARLWTDSYLGLSLPSPPPQLSIGVAVFEGAFAYKMSLSRLVDGFGSGTGFATTWKQPTAAWPAIGTHSGDASFIMQQLSEEIDAFILAYLRVNEGSC